MINLQTENLHTRLDVLIRISVWKNNQFKRLCRVAASSNSAINSDAKQARAIGAQLFAAGCGER